VEQVLVEYEAWQGRVSKLTGERKAAYEVFVEGRTPKNLFERLVLAHDTKKDATRSSGGRMLQAVAKAVPQLVSGSADLAASTKTDIVGEGFVRRGQYGPRNFHFGVREHAMGSVANGLALSGFIPVVSTFLIFSDYMRPTLRLASMMKQRVAFVYTHDSFFVGEDGPTHQPIEQVASLRLIPGLRLWRPADSLECAAAWAETIERSDGPTVMALTRQNLPPPPRPEGFEPTLIRRGAYVVIERDQPSVVLVASGSEVHVAIDAGALLEAKGHRVRVVSMPCVEAFSSWPRAEQEALLGPDAARVSLEAGVTGPWHSIVGVAGLALGIDHFGASAPAEILQKEFGLTAESVAASIEAVRFPASS
jgi:transketolase